MFSFYSVSILFLRETKSPANWTLWEEKVGIFFTFGLFLSPSMIKKSWGERDSTELKDPWERIHCLILQTPRRSTTTGGHCERWKRMRERSWDFPFSFLHSAIKFGRWSFLSQMKWSEITSIKGRKRTRIAIFDCGSERERKTALLSSGCFSSWKDFFGPPADKDHLHKTVET